MLQFGVSLTDDTRSVNYDRNMFIIQAIGRHVKKFESLVCIPLNCVEVQTNGAISPHSSANLNELN